MLAPGATIGILGGGQLGRMMAQAAASLGFHVHVFTNLPDGPALEVARQGTVGAYDDHSALAQFAAECDVVTLEFENIPVAAVQWLADRLPVRPGARALAICQDRMLEKRFLRDVASLPTARWRAVETAQELLSAVTHWGTPAILKASRSGYDGHGQARVDTPDQVESAWQSVFQDARRGTAVVEEIVDFEFELSVIVARDVHDGIAVYEPSRNDHTHQILHRCTVPASLPPQVTLRAHAIAREIARSLDYVGVMGVELFYTRTGDLLVNEMAPRPHNSGHWTLDAAVTSQFEQAIRAAAGWQLGSTRRHSDVTSTNIFGDDLPLPAATLQDPENRVYLYGKGDPRPRRKMGHINRLTPRSDAD